jgi:hypothetical protein
MVLVAFLSWQNICADVDDDTPKSIPVFSEFVLLRTPNVKSSIDNTALAINPVCKNCVEPLNCQPLVLKEGAADVLNK